MKVLPIVPNGLEEIKALYGDPQHIPGKPDVEWERENLSTFQLPYPLRLSWDKDTLVSTVTAHKLVGEYICDALDEIGQYNGGWYLDKFGYNRFGGIYNPRFKRGIDELSTHAWGIAIDLNPHLGPLGEESKMPDFIVKAFTNRGFVWGGVFPRPDGMHFQACSGY